MRGHSPPNQMARHRSLRRAVASASAKMPRRLCILGLTDRSSETQSTPTPPMSAPGGLARRFWSDASANHMSVTSLRDHSPPTRMALHCSLRRATASASAKMPRTWAHSAGFLTKKKVCLFLTLPPVGFRTLGSRKKNLNCLSASAGTSWKCRRFGRESGRFSVSLITELSQNCKNEKSPAERPGRGGANGSRSPLPEI